MRLRRAIRWLPGCFAVLLLTFLSIACSDSSSLDKLAVLDSWIAERDLRVGSIDDPDYSLTWFRTLAVSEAGRIYTVHGQEQLVRVFEPDGTLYMTIGGRGEGPGEFQNVGPIGWVADTLWVLDFSLYRFNLFSEDGEFIYSFTVPFGSREGPDQPQPPRANGLLSDGTVHGAPPAFSSQIEDGTITDHEVLLMSRDGEVTDSIASIPFGNNQWAVYDPDEPRKGMLFGRQPYGDGPLWAFLPEERALAILDREAPSRPEDAQFRLLKLSLTGDTIFFREYPYLPVPLTKEETDSTLDHQVNQWAEYNVMGGVTAARLRTWAEPELYTPPYWPPITQMVIGMDGGYWLRGRPDVGETVEWYVLDASGVPRGRVDLPVGFQMLAAESTRVWGTETDDLDVPYLLRFSIDHGSG
jgi:hypothetical protein